MPFPMSPPPVPACDAAAAEAVVSRLEDQAFAAMKAATEKVALAARSGPVGAAGDAEWAEYKRLRAEADRSRADAIACRVRPVIATAPAPAQSPPNAPPLVEAAPIAAASDYADPGAPRFRVEASVFQADRQPSSAGRMRVETRAGYAYSPTPTLPNPPSVSDYTVTSVGDGPRQKVRSWSSGFALAGEFAPAGLGAGGWRFTSRIGNQLERTKSEIEPFTPSYVITGPTERVVPCLGCSATYRTPVTLDLVFYRAGLGASRLYGDNLKQTSKKVDLDFGVVRDFSLTEAFGGLRASLGGELGAGWWTLEEREFMVVTGGNVDIFRSSDGPVGRAALTAVLSAPVPRIEGVSWSIRSRIGYEIADLTTTQALFDISSASSRTTVQDMSDGTIGSLGARLDYVNGAFGGFVAVERRRDLSLNSVQSAPGVLGRVSEPFPDSSAVYVWPVYSSRLTVGVNYGF